MTRFGAVALLPLALLAAACDDGPPPAPEYYDRVIQPILTASCIRNQSGCHKDDGTGNALGNLDLTSYENATRRRDVVRTYGSYPEPLLLIKAAGPGGAAPKIPYKPGTGDGTTAFLDLQVQHAGGAPITRDSQAFFTLQQWLANGATRDGAIADKVLDNTGHGACTSDFAAARPDLAAKYMAQLPIVDSDPMLSPLFTQFKSDVEPILSQNCAFGSCHSSPQSDFFLACDDDMGARFNFLQAVDFTSKPPESSEFLLRPLAPGSGGVSHTGGVFFQTKTDSNYKAILAWATAVDAAGLPDQSAMIGAGHTFFNEHVMPVLLQRGCALEACHSPGAANDFKLRPGSQGYFSSSALDRDYEEARRLFLDVDVPDPRVSRILRKPIVRVSEGGLGISHRGGPVLESAGDPAQPDATACLAMAFDPATTSAFCTLVWWAKTERDDLLAAGTVDALDSHLGIVYVDRPADSDRFIDTDTYHPGADLKIAQGALSGLAHLDSIAAGSSLLAQCPGSAGARDVRHPDVDYDAKRVVFAMRLGATAADPWKLYVVSIDGATCTAVDTKQPGAGAIPAHDLDPIFAPTTPSSIVFASTRGGRAGQTVSLKYFLPQADLWRLPGNAGGFDAPVQLTAGLGSELAPAMMMNGEISMTAEKASAEFYQLSGRRINWDGTDYHPLLAQRKDSKGFDPPTSSASQALGTAFAALPEHPSVGFQRATEIREGIDRNFVFVASNEGDPGMGGQLVTFNRSVGPFEADRSNPGFLESLEVVDAGDPGGGYRSPIQLPDGRYLASYTGTLATGNYALAVVDPATHQRQVLLDCGARACVQAVPVYQRERRPLFDNVAQLVFGGNALGMAAGHGQVTYPDLPMLATLLGANLRTGRFVDGLRAATQVAVYQDVGPPDAATGMAGVAGSQMVYQSRMPLGNAKLQQDGSAKLLLPSLTPLIVELQDSAGNPVFTMGEEDQLGEGEQISRGVPQPFFNSVCGGCHGSVSGRELDVAITPDALTGASLSAVHDSSANQLGP